jgi:ribosomal protein S18 acetylase RimI-like enzyme
MKTNEPYNDSIKSSAPSSELVFRIAETKDLDAVINLMAERNPTQDTEKIRQTSLREISLNSSDPKYRLFVADINGSVVGLCRYYHSEGLPKEKLLYPAPVGWYCMGLLVDKEMRRQGIARFLFENRLKAMKDSGATIIYSMVDEDNKASMKMHKSFRFQEIERAQGFLHIKFDEAGVLFQMNLHTNSKT